MPTRCYAPVFSMNTRRQRTAGKGNQVPFDETHFKGKPLIIQQSIAVKPPPVGAAIHCAKPNLLPARGGGRPFSTDVFVRRQRFGRLPMAVARDAVALEDLALEGPARGAPTKQSRRGQTAG